MTMAELYGPAMAAQDQETADRIFAQCVEEHLKSAPEHSREEAERVERSNLGYYAGYYGSETRRRVERLFKTVHPIFGSIEKHGEPTPEMCFEIGRLWGGGSRN
jgi:hypothetical protein